MADSNHSWDPLENKKSNDPIGLGYALKGVFVFFRDGRNAKIHLLAAVVVIAAGFFFRITLPEWLWISLAIAIVLITEMINTSIELLCDLVMPNQNEKAGKLKDIAAGAVLVAVVFALVVAGIIFWKYLFE
ncbi:MAG: diacylglycerol kinase family protein [Crocinitomicaceae bacterium]|jgi:diacylglycerol kinase (ATP)|nr:diacylglycerol kinase family protein [Crocinitomicaceae bacterium]